VAESVTCTVKLKGPALVGVPLIVPVLLLMLRPLGKVPLLTVKVSGGVSPVTLMGAVYEAPTVGLLRLVVVKVMAGTSRASRDSTLSTA